MQTKSKIGIISTMVLFMVGISLILSAALANSYIALMIGLAVVILVTLSVMYALIWAAIQDGKNDSN